MSEAHALRLFSQEKLTPATKTRFSFRARVQGEATSFFASSCKASILFWGRNRIMTLTPCCGMWKHLLSSLCHYNSALGLWYFLAFHDNCGKLTENGKYSELMSFDVLVHEATSDDFPSNIFTGVHAKILIRILFMQIRAFGVRQSRTLLVDLQFSQFIACMRQRQARKARPRF